MIFTSFYLETRTLDTQYSFFLLKSRTFGLEQTNWANNFWGIWAKYKEAFSTLVESLLQMTCIDFTNFFILASEPVITGSLILAEFAIKNAFFSRNVVF